MRPINLKIQGINSYVTEQEICFDKLSESNLFGVFGETGSGKTTILDAIIIALYGSSDREIIPNIINVNCDIAHIYFKFRIEDGEHDKTYLVKRDYFVRKSGIKSDAILLDENDKVIRPAILWNDGRTFAEVEYLNGEIGKDKLSELTANIAFAGFTAPKILWVKERVDIQPANTV